MEHTTVKWKDVCCRSTIIIVLCDTEENNNNKLKIEEKEVRKKRTMNMPWNEHTPTHTLSPTPYIQFMYPHPRFQLLDMFASTLVSLFLFLFFSTAIQYVQTHTYCMHKSGFLFSLYCCYWKRVYKFIAYPATFMHKFTYFIHFLNK